MVLSLVIGILTIVANWKIYTKMGRKGWESIIPCYNMYVLFDVLYGNGWKFLLLLIPFYNIYLTFKLYIDLAHDFDQSTGFGIGLVLLNTIFVLILGFGSNEFKGGAFDVSDEDPLSNAVDNAMDNMKARLEHDPNALEKIRELDEMHNQGMLTDEEYEAKKAELMKRV